MPQEKFPERDKKRDNEVIEAMTSPDNLSEATKAGVRLVPSPKINKTKEIEEDSEVMISLDKGSIELLVYNIIQSQYRSLNIKLGAREGYPYLYAGGEGSRILQEILHDPVIQVLEMEVPKINYIEGLNLESRKIIEPAGTTNKIYVKYLVDQIKRLQRNTRKDAMEKSDEFKKELADFTVKGVKAPTEKEINDLRNELVSKVIERVVAKHKQKNKE